MSTKYSMLLLLGVMIAAGCAAQPKQAPIAPRGEVVAQGTGPLSFRTSERGLVSVYDSRINAVVHSSGVGAGSVVTVTPAAGTITVTDAGAGTQVVYSGLSKSHRYEIWFIPAHGGGTTATRPYAR